MILLVSFLLLFFLFPATGLALAAAAGTTSSVGRAIVHELLAQPSQSQKEQLILCLVRPHRLEEEEAYWNGIVKDKASSSSCTVQVLPYDMLDGGTTLRAALDQCNSDNDNLPICLYHVASVFGPTENHKETALENVKGACNVVETVHAWRTANDKQPSACKVILTSSMAAVRGTGQDPINGKFYTADDWNTVSVLGQNWYVT